MKDILKQAASIALEYNEIMNHLSQIRHELYDCAEIPHMFDFLLEENLLQTFANDQVQITNSLEYMKETGQISLYIQTKQNIKNICKKIEELAPRICSANKQFLKIRGELQGSTNNISNTLLDQLDCQSYMINRYFQDI
ncbi:hypothetical protein ABPG72_021500 [Tetrahymena utriculariae]